MKKILPQLLLLLLPMLTLAQWTNLGIQGMPLKMTSDYHGVKIANIQDSIAANGSIWTTYRTDDDWVTQMTESTGGGGNIGCCTIEQMDFLNDSVGAMLRADNGLRGVSHTTDRGMSWQVLGQGAQTGLTPIADLQVFGDSVAYTMGHGSSSFSALATRYTPSGFANVYQSASHEGSDGRIYFVNDSLGFVIAHDNAGIYKVFRTTNGGTSWSQRLAVGIGPLRAIDFVSPNIGFVAGESGVCYATTDQGFTWNSLAINGPVDVHDIDFIDAQTGFIVGGGGLVLRTSDGGISWGTDVIDSNKTVVYVKAITTTIAYAMTSDSVLYKRDYVAGENDAWKPETMISIYPNPTENWLHIALPHGLHLRSWKLGNLQGQWLKSGDGMDVSLEDLPSGIYLLEVLSNRGMQRVKVVRRGE